MASRNLENAFVTVWRLLTPDKLHDINSLFVKLASAQQNWWICSLTWQIGRLEAQGKHSRGTYLWRKILNFAFETVHSGVVIFLSDDGAPETLRGLG